MFHTDSVISQTTQFCTCCNYSN